MQKLFRLTALLAAAVLVIGVVGIVGCGDDDDDDDDGGTVAAVTAVTPADGSEVPANTSITVTFDNAPEEGSVTIAGQAATLAGKKATIDNAGLSEGSQTVSIAWTSTNGEAGSHSVTYTVLPEDTTPPELTGGNVEDGGSGYSPDELNADGIALDFSEEIDSASLVMMQAGTELNWRFSPDGNAVIGTPLPGADVGFETEYTIEGTVSDAAGNETEVSITFTTEAKEE